MLSPESIIFLTMLTIAGCDSYDNRYQTTNINMAPISGITSDTIHSNKSNTAYNRHRTNINSWSSLDQENLTSSSRKEFYTPIQNFKNQLEGLTVLPDTIIPMNIKFESVESTNGVSFEKTCSMEGSIKIKALNLHACINYFEGNLTIGTKNSRSDSIRLWDPIFIDDNKESFIDSFRIVKINKTDMLEITIKFESNRNSYSRKVLIDLHKCLLLFNLPTWTYYQGGSLEGTESETCNADYQIKLGVLTLSSLDCQMYSNKLKQNPNDNSGEIPNSKKENQAFQYTFKNNKLIKLKN
jgi:hypothetical protein